MSEFVRVAEMEPDLSRQIVVRAEITGGDLITLRFQKEPKDAEVKKEVNRVLAAQRQAERSALRAEMDGIDAEIDRLRARKVELKVSVEEI